MGNCSQSQCPKVELGGISFDRLVEDDSDNEVVFQEVYPDISNFIQSDTSRETGQGPRAVQRRNVSWLREKSLTRIQIPATSPSSSDALGLGPALIYQ